MDAYSVLQHFVAPFQGGFAFVGVLLVIAGIVIAILANAFGAVDIDWAKLPSA